MSELIRQVQSDMIAAMKAREQVRLSTLRLLKAAFETEQAQKGHEKGMSDDEAIGIVQRLVKQRNEAAAAYRDAGQLERSAAELAEAEILMSYLPAQLSDEELKSLVREVVETVGAQGPKDLGRVMGPVMGRAKGKADGNRVRQMVQSILQS